MSDELTRSPTAPRSDLFPWLDSGRLDLVVAAMIVVQSVILFVLERGGFFYQDDFLNLRLAQLSPLNLHYLFTPNFQHIEPGVRLEYWLVVHLIGLHYDLVLIVVVALIGLTTWVLYRVLRLLFAPSAWMVGLVLLFGLWAGWLGASTWLAAAFEVVPSALASAVTVYAFCRRLKGGGDLWIAMTGLAFAAGLAFYESTMVVIPALVVCLLAVAAEQAPTVAWRLLFRRAAAPLAWCVFAGAAFIAVFLSKVHAPLGHLPTPGALAFFLLNSWSRTFVPTFLGGPFWWQWTGPRGDGVAPLWFMILSEALLVAAVVVTVRRTGGRAAIGWGLVALPFLLLLTLVGVARITQFGNPIGDDYQYLVDAFVPAVVGLGFVTMGRREPKPRAARWVWGRRALAGCLVVVYLLSFLHSALPASARWSTNQGRQYLSTLRLGLVDAAQAHPHNWSIYNTTIPVTLLFESAWPYTSLESFTRLWGLPAPIDVAGSHLYVVEAGGQLALGTLPASGAVGPTCAQAGSAVDILLPHPLPGGVWTVQATLAGQQGRLVNLAVSSSSLGALSAAIVTARADSPGGTVLFSFYWPTPIRWLSINVPGVTQPCVTRMIIGDPAPRG